MFDKLNDSTSVEDDNGGVVTTLTSGNNISISATGEISSEAVTTNTTYGLGTSNGVTAGDIELNLDASGTASDSTVTIRPGTGISLSQASDVLTITNDVTDTTYGLATAFQ
jgi:hypothetical protein